MTQAKYNEIIERLQECVNAYQKANIQDNKTTIYLANGDVLNIRIPKNGIAHLLGVNIDYLRQTGLLKKELNSYECLSYLIENSYTFAKLIFRDKKMNIENIFSKNIEEKLNSFWENIHIRIDDLIAVIKYDNERTYQSEFPIDVSDYFIIRKKQNSYYVLGLIKNEERGQAYVPTTSRKYNEFKYIYNLMNKIAYKQELTLINNEKIDNESEDYHVNIYINNEEKVKRIDQLISLGKKYNASVVVANDFLYYLRKNTTQKEENNHTLETLLLLKKHLKKRKILETAELEYEEELPEDIKELISLSNDLICSIRDKAIVKYSEVTEENKKLKEELQILKKQLEESKEKAKEQNTLLEEKLKENKTYEEQMQILEESYLKIKSLSPKKG